MAQPSLPAFARALVDPVLCVPADGLVAPEAPVSGANVVAALNERPDAGVGNAALDLDEASIRHRLSGRLR